jgi:hypothetical protein
MAEGLSLCATAWFVWHFALAPQLAGSTPIQLMLRGMGFAVAAWLWSLVIAFLLHFAIRQVEQVDVAGATLRTSAAAVWFAPATILMIHLSPLALPVALVLVVNATRLLYSEWRLIHPETERVAILVPLEAGLLGSGELPVGFLPRHFAPALLIACAIQSAGAAELMRRTLMAAALFALSAALLTVFAISAGAWEEARRPTLPRTIIGLIMTVLLAGTITLVGLAGGGGVEEGFNPLGLGSGNSAVPPKSPPVPLPDLKKAGGEPAPKPEDKPDVPVVTGPEMDGSFPGVILWPEVKKVTMLIEPMQAVGGRFARSTQPYVIPFGGEYWMFRFLLPRPPRNSFFQRGSPAKLSFSTTDHWPMQMEAHQKLPQDIDLSCCGKIQIGISNADRFPGTVTLELKVVSADPAHVEFTLGKDMVTSVPFLRSDPVAPVSETLDYPVPVEMAGRQINEFKVIYQRVRGRTDKSAKIAIERFVLVPRGM